MCGIVGWLGPPGPDPRAGIERMLGLVQHRGPEAAGAFLDDHVALGFAWLSIVDLDRGMQPLANEDGTVWLVCNGEVFNHLELRSALLARGHRFRTGSDCETIVHLYEECGAGSVEALNGDFAFALWDRRRRRLLLGRDRFGVRPLYYASSGDRLLFGSEVKALLAAGLPRRLDPVALGQVFTYWAPLPPRTMFAGVRSLRPGHLLLAGAGPDGGAPAAEVRQWWQLGFPEPGAELHLPAAEAAAQLRELLEDATRIRMRADVPVGSYLSGGVDSSAVTALACRSLEAGRLETFSVSFTDPHYDERPHQEAVAAAMGTRHHVVVCRPEDIAGVLPEVVWHTEAPLLRTAPAPLFLLSRLVQRQGLKVVLTGEGADEFQAGYDIFKEALVRAFWARRPDSRLRPLLLRRIYPDIPAIGRLSQPYLQAFFGTGLDEVGGRDFTHHLRWRTTGRLRRFLTPDVRQAVAEAGSAELDALLDGLGPWHVLARAQYTEAVTFLDPYLLSSQGDRMAMAHAVETRFPFLDHRVVELANALPPQLKMRGLDEKHLLKLAVADLVPEAVLRRVKRPFRAPIQAAFAGAGAPEYVRELLEPGRLAEEGILKPEPAARLLARAAGETRLGETEEMALAGLVSVGLFRHLFWEEFQARAARCARLSVCTDQRAAPEAHDLPAAGV